MGDDTQLTCGTCDIGTPVQILGNGITEPPYMTVIRCPYDTQYYRYLGDECNHREEAQG